MPRLNLYLFLVSFFFFLELKLSCFSSSCLGTFHLSLLLYVLLYLVDWWLPGWLALCVSFSFSVFLFPVFSLLWSLDFSFYLLCLPSSLGIGHSVFYWIIRYLR